MKTLKLIAALALPALLALSTSAQNCPGNKVRMSLGVKGKHCSCQKICVNPSEVATYQANYWRIGDCPQFNCGNPGWRGLDDNEIYETTLVDVYPNPATGSTTIFFSLSNPEHVSIRIFDMSGRVIITLTDQVSNQGENQVTWNTTDIKPGMYFLRMETGSYSEMKKISVIN